MDKEYIKVKTRDNTKALIKKDQISAIEVVPGSARSESYLKLYVAGYHFSVPMELDELEKLLKE